MSPDTYVRKISVADLETATSLGTAIVKGPAAEYASMEPELSAPDFVDDAARAKWVKEREDKRRQERKEREEQEEHRRKEAEAKFKDWLDDRLTEEFNAGAEYSVSREARTAVTVRSYVLLGVVAAVVSMPLIGMLLHLDPQAFGAYIAPVTGITGTIVGYWFGTITQGSTGQGPTGQGPTGQGPTRQPPAPM